MKLYEAIENIVLEFGKEIVTNAKAVNIFSDYNAFEESKTFKVIIKNLIAEGYMDQLMYVRDWESNCERITTNFIVATSFNEANASYVIKSLGYGLGYTKDKPVYTPTASCQSSAGQASAGQAPNAKPTAPSAPQSAPANVQGVQLDKTESQIDRLSEAAQRKYKEAAESYLESIIEYKSDFHQDLGVQVSHSVEYQSCGFSVRFEISGKYKVDYDYAIKYFVLLYDAANRLISKEEIYTGENHKSFEVGEAYIQSNQYHKVSNIKRIVVYWEEN